MSVWLSAQLSSKPVTVSAVARQARHHQPQDGPCLAQPHLGDQLLKACPSHGRGARRAQIVIDNHNAFFGPAHSHHRGRPSKDAAGNSIRLAPGRA